MCESRSQLAGRFAIAARKYAEAAVRLGARDLKQSEYARLFENAEGALREAETAGKALKEHIDRDQCGDGGRPAVMER